MRILLLALALFLTASVQADQISDQVGKLKAQDSRLDKPVTIWRPAICIGDLLEQASEQTGAPVYAEDLDGAAGEIVGVYVKNQPLGQLMESLASLLSERGAVWEWRKTVGRKGEVGYRFYSVASKSQGRLLAEANQCYFDALERAISRKAFGDEGASQLTEDAPEALRLLGQWTNSAQRRSMIFQGTRVSVPKSSLPESVKLPESEMELVISRTQKYDLFPHLTLSARVDDPELKLTESLLKHTVRLAIQRWYLPDDADETTLSWPADPGVWTRHQDDGNSLDRIARCTGIPLLVRGENRIPALGEMPSTPRSFEECWEKLGKGDPTKPQCWSRKARGKTLLVRTWNREDVGQYPVQLPWLFFKEASRRAQSVSGERDAGNYLLWLMNATMGQSRAAFSISNCYLIPESLVSNIIGQIIVVADGIVSYRMVDDLIGVLWSNQALGDRAFSLSGVPVRNLDLSMPSLVRTADEVGLPDSVRSAALRLEVSHPLYVNSPSDIWTEVDWKLVKGYRLGIRPSRKPVEIRVFLHPSEGMETLLRTYKIAPGRLFIKPPP